MNQLKNHVPDWGRWDLLCFPLNRSGFCSTASDCSSYKRLRTWAVSIFSSQKLVSSPVSDINCQGKMDWFGHNKAGEEGEFHAFGSISYFNCSSFSVQGEELCSLHRSLQSAGALLRFSSGALSRKSWWNPGKPVPEIESCAICNIQYSAASLKHMLN